MATPPFENMQYDRLSQQQLGFLMTTGASLTMSVCRYGGRVSAQWRKEPSSFAQQRVGYRLTVVAVGGSVACGDIY